MPLLHIDIHGKTDRQTNCEIDIGFMSMKVHWNEDPIIEKISHFFSNKDEIFGQHVYKGYKCKFNIDPVLHGYWGGW